MTHEEQQQWIKIRTRLMPQEGRVDLEHPYKKPKPKQPRHKPIHLNGEQLLRELYGLW